MYMFLLLSLTGYFTDGEKYTFNFKRIQEIFSDIAG